MTEADVEDVVLSPWSRNVRSRSPNALQTIASPSAPAVATKNPFGLNAARCTRAGCGSTASTWPSGSITRAPRWPATTNLRDAGPEAAKRVSGGTGTVAITLPRGRARTVRIPARTVSARPSESHVCAPRCGCRTTRPAFRLDEPHAAALGDGGKDAAGQRGKIAHGRSQVRDGADAGFLQRPPGRSLGPRRRRQAGCARRQQQPELGVGTQLHDRVRLELPSLRGQRARVGRKRLLPRIGSLRQRPHGECGRPASATSAMTATTATRL